MTGQFRRVAVLNRGEAAMRFMRGALAWSRRSGRELETVAFYTSADTKAPFVKKATRAVYLGEPFGLDAEGRRRLVYVDLDGLMAHVEASGADAVWPGWGFLAEHPELAEACQARGITFIGPPASAMHTLSDKVAAKRLATEVGVPVLPWSEVPVTSADEAREHLARIGYPALLKSAGGGGGRGIRLVEHDGELERLFAAASAEALATCGDSSLFVEAFVPRARHIEVQILADRHGAVWTLGTRDCSVQRRNQKIFEEAPAPGLAPDVERAICEAAEALARACGYEGVGTAEFLLLPDGQTFYFLEMNTRLQVEHTVTEAVYGFDLVCAQIDVAQGARLDEMERPEPRGSAIEARLNAEDPDDHFAPRTGTIVRFVPPQGPWVRVDSGYGEGNGVSEAFDSNIAKIIAWGNSREDALARLEAALHDTVCGLETGLTNRSLLLEIVADTQFRAEPVWTRWLDGYLERRTPPARRPHLPIALVAAAIGDHLGARRQDLTLFFAEALTGLPRRVPTAGPRLLKYLVGGALVELSVATLEPRTYQVCCGPWEAVVRARSTGTSAMLLEVDGRRFSVLRIATSNEIKIEVEGVAHTLERVSDGRVLAPIPSAVSHVHVERGEHVVPGTRLVTLEAMKMEFPVASPLEGIVRALHVSASDSVAVGDLLVEIEAVVDEARERDGAGNDGAGNDGAGNDGAGNDGAEGLRLEAHTREPLAVADVLEAALLGYDVERALVDRALELLVSGQCDTSAGRLLELFSAHVLTACLFLRGKADLAVNEARESSREQLAWLLRQRRLDEDVLSEAFIRRIRHLLRLHDITDPRPGARLDNALMRLFQSRLDRRGNEAIAIALLEALEAAAPQQRARRERVAQAFAWTAGSLRPVLEHFAAGAVEARSWKLAALTWSFLHDWCEDEPAPLDAPHLDAPDSDDTHPDDTHPDDSGDVRWSELVARHLERFEQFEIEALETPLPHRAPSSTRAFAARHREVADDRRVLVLGHVARFEAVEEAGELRVPELERVFLEAAHVVRTRLQSAAARGEAVPAWNRITLHIAPPVDLPDEAWGRLARRFALKTLDLSLEKVVLEVDHRERGPLEITWPDAAGLGPLSRIAPPDTTPTGALTRHERGILAARSRGLFYPYEVIAWLCERGTFEELELVADDSLELGPATAPAADGGGTTTSPGAHEPRAWGENPANLVVGLVSTPTARFPEGVRRVLVIGDATRTMGSLGEAECRRIIGAIDRAEREGLPLEWIALSSGARIAFDSGTENLDWTARVLRRVVEFTQAGGTIHVIVDGPCVGAQSYWNAEATMLMHCKGALVMTPRGYMILTGRRALEYSGSVAAETNQALGGLEIMVPNGEAQYVADDLLEAYAVLLRHYDLTYVPPGATGCRPAPCVDALDRDVREAPLELDAAAAAGQAGQAAGEGGFSRLGEIFDDATNPGRKRAFPIRAVMRAVLDRDVEPLERWEGLEGGESAVCWLGQLGGQPVTLIGIESRPVRRKGLRPVDGPESWMSGTLFPRSSYKVARALQAASGVHPAVVLANLSGFDGSPESLRERQLEWGAEIARAVVNFRGPIVFCVIARYHGGAFVVFSQALNEGLKASALQGTYASVIGGAPAAAVVFPGLVERRTQRDPRLVAARDEGPEHAARLYPQVRGEVQGAVAREFDEVHCIERAREVGSLEHILAPADLRRFLCEAVRPG